MKLLTKDKINYNSHELEAIELAKEWVKTVIRIARPEYWSISLRIRDDVDILLPPFYPYIDINADNIDWFPFDSLLYRFCPDSTIWNVHYSSDSNRIDSIGNIDVGKITEDSINMTARERVFGFIPGCSLSSINCFAIGTRYLELGEYISKTIVVENEEFEKTIPQLETYISEKIGGDIPNDYLQRMQKCLRTECDSPYNQDVHPIYKCRGLINEYYSTYKEGYKLTGRYGDKDVIFEERLLRERIT